MFHTIQSDTLTISPSHAIVVDQLKRLYEASDLDGIKVYLNTLRRKSVERINKLNFSRNSVVHIAEFADQSITKDVLVERLRKICLDFNSSISNFVEVTDTTKSSSNTGDVGVVTRVSFKNDIKDFKVPEDNNCKSHITNIEFYDPSDRKTKYMNFFIHAQFILPDATNTSTIITHLKGLNTINGITKFFNQVPPTYYIPSNLDKMNIKESAYGLKCKERGKPLELGKKLAKFRYMPSNSESYNYKLKSLGIDANNLECISCIEVTGKTLLIALNLEFDEKVLSKLHYFGREIYLDEMTIEDMKSEGVPDEVFQAELDV